MADGRDAKTKFEQQAKLQQKPTLDPGKMLELHQNNNVRVVDSFNIARTNKELFLLLKCGTSEIGLRLNPDVVFHLATNLLKQGGTLGWYQVEMKDGKPPVRN